MNREVKVSAPQRSVSPVSVILVIFAAALWGVAVLFALVWIALNRLVGRKLEPPRFPDTKPGRA